MDIRSHPDDLTESLNSLEGPGQKVQTELNDFLAHEREGLIKNDSSTVSISNDNVNNVDRTLSSLVSPYQGSETVNITDDTKSKIVTEETANVIENIEPVNKSENTEENIKIIEEAGTSNKENIENTNRIECLETEENESAEKQEEEEEKEEEWLDILGSGQLKKKIVKRAENSFKPQRSNIVEINIEGQLPDGTIIDKQNNFTLQIGSAEHIQALDLALPLMEVGEVALLDVQPRFGYGSLGREPDIPPNTKIMYTVELLSAEEEPEIENLPTEKRKEIGCQKRERGNHWYTRQEYSLAIQCYRNALNFLDDNAGSLSFPNSDSNENTRDDEMLKDLLEERLKVYNNLAAAQMKIKAFDMALKSVDYVLCCQPANVKALYRKGKILSEKGEHSKAVEVLKEASRLEPDNRMIRQELIQIMTRYKKDTKNEKNLYKKMLGQDKPSVEDTPPKSNKFQFPWSIAFGTFAALVAGVVAYRYKFI